MINIDNQGNGFENTIEEARKVAAYEALGRKDSLHLQLCAEGTLANTIKIGIRGGTVDMTVITSFG